MDVDNKEEALNTTTPEKCPKCGAEVFHSSKAVQEFKCRTLIVNGGSTFEGGDCAKRQRDKLATTVYELREMVEYLAAMGDKLAMELNKVGGFKELTDAYKGQSGLIKKNFVRLLGKDE